MCQGCSSALCPAHVAEEHLKTLAKLFGPNVVRDLPLFPSTDGQTVSKGGNWWLHSNKQGSNTMPLIDRSDDKRALSTCNDYNKKQEKNHTCLLILTSTNNGRHKVHLLHGGIGKVLGGLLIIQKVKKEVSQVLSERRDPFLAVFDKNLRKRLS